MSNELRFSRRVLPRARGTLWRRTLTLAGAGLAALALASCNGHGFGGTGGTGGGVSSGGDGASTAAVVTSVQVTPANANAHPNDTVQFKAEATFSDNSTQDVTDAATWSSSKDTVATIGSAPSSGVANAVAAGNTAIAASVGGVTSAAATLKVADWHETVLHGFAGGASDGSWPEGERGLLEGGDGLLYGTTTAGGVTNNGTVFRIKTDGTSYQVLWSFGGDPDGSNPDSSLIEDSDGWLYGTTSSGGTAGNGNEAGTVFRLKTDGTGEQVLFNFSSSNNGASEPIANLIQGSDGLLYGTATLLGPNPTGAVFQIKADGTGYAVLYPFVGGTDGAGPRAGLIQGSDGLLYGTTKSGGANGNGTVFQLKTDGTGHQVLYSFGSSGGDDGATPYSSLLQASDGWLYGTTSAGGDTNGDGTVFRLKPDGTGYQVLYRFGTIDAKDAITPDAGLIQGSDGWLYGTTAAGGTNSKGTVFRLRTDGSGEEVVWSFGGNGDGTDPEASLIQGSDGRLYGTTYGLNTGDNGTVFSLQ